MKTHQHAANRDKDNCVAAVAAVAMAVVAVFLAVWALAAVKVVGVVKNYAFVQDKVVGGGDDKDIRDERGFTSDIETNLLVSDLYNLRFAQ